MISLDEMRTFWSDAEIGELCASGSVTLIGCSTTSIKVAPNGLSARDVVVALRVLAAEPDGD